MDTDCVAYRDFQ